MLEKIDVIIPCYRVSGQVCQVIAELLELSLVRRIVVVDDKCPDSSGLLVQEKYDGNPRVRVLFHAQNKGVGGAMITGYSYAFENGAQIAVKVDGDGQMPLAKLDQLVSPLLEGRADFTKGNRFYTPRQLAQMPLTRLVGNAGLSLINKFASGYWSVMDPTNGFIAIHKAAYAAIEPDKLSNDYFFESDLLYQLGIARAVVMDIPTPVIYGDEISSLNIRRTLFQFPTKLATRFFKRLLYHYFIRDFTIASLELLFGIPLLFSGLAFGLHNWAINAARDTTTPPGTVMIVGLLILIGFQLLLSALNYDIQREPKVTLMSLDMPRKPLGNDTKKESTHP